MKRTNSKTSSSIARVIRAGAALCLLAAVLGGCEWGDKTDGKTEATIIIAPTSASLSATAVGTVNFTATGGVGVLTWNVSNTRLGLIYSAGATATYQSKTNSNSTGVNVVTVTDQDGNTASATVAQD